jgi:hypothetical protein
MTSPADELERALKVASFSDQTEFYNEVDTLLRGVQNLVDKGLPLGEANQRRLASFSMGMRNRGSALLALGDLLDQSGRVLSDAVTRQNVQQIPTTLLAVLTRVKRDLGQRIG